MCRLTITFFFLQRFILFYWLKQNKKYSRNEIYHVSIHNTRIFFKVWIASFILEVYVIFIMICSFYSSEAMKHENISRKKTTCKSHGLVGAWNFFTRHFVKHRACRFCVIHHTPGILSWQIFLSFYTSADVSLCA